MSVYAIFFYILFFCQLLRLRAFRNFDFFAWCQEVLNLQSTSRRCIAVYCKSICHMQAVPHNLLVTSSVQNAMGVPLGKWKALLCGGAGFFIDWFNCISNFIKTSLKWSTIACKMHFKGPARGKPLTNSPSSPVSSCILCRLKKCLVSSGAETTT